MQFLTHALMIALFVPLVVVAQDETEPEDQPLEETEELSPEEFDRFLQELEEHGFARVPKKPQPEQGQREFSGKWIEEGGERYCDGYLTRNADEAYCSADIPEDWRPFEFNGDTFFVTPLRNDPATN